jgi:hypothetical protein
MDQVCQDKIGRLGGVAGSVVLYVSLITFLLEYKVIVPSNELDSYLRASYKSIRKSNRYSICKTFIDIYIASFIANL